jgi:hypothetical protein
LRQNLGFFNFELEEIFPKFLPAPKIENQPVWDQSNPWETLGQSSKLKKCQRAKLEKAYEKESLARLIV